MNSLLVLVENLNKSLETMVGSKVKSALDVCKLVRENIKTNEFYKELEKNELENLIVFQDDIENMKFIFLRSSETDTDYRKIIEIFFQINYYNDSDPSQGGILTNVLCKLIGIGERVKDIPIEAVITGLQLSDVLAKEKQIEIKIEEMETNLTDLKEMRDSYQIQKNELAEALELFKQKQQKEEKNEKEK